MEIMKLKSKITEIKYLLDEFNSRLEIVKEIIGEFRDIAIEIIQSEKGGKWLKKNEQRLKYLWDNTAVSKMCISRVPGRKRDRERGRTFLGRNSG